MPRALRGQYPGAIYHVMNRGDHREPIFRDHLDNKKFLATLAEACTKTDWHVHAYCLMHNHFHLVVETPTANLVAGMRCFLSTYTARFKPIRRGWCLGDETFRKELLESVGTGASEPYRADARQETTEEEARRILNEELDMLGWTGAELAGRPKGDARKIRIARRLRAETAVTLKWIATELQMGALTPVANRLYDTPSQSDHQPDLNLCQKYGATPLLPGEYENLDGKAGQNNDNPPGTFKNHVIVQYASKYYDPSYGAGPFTTLNEWEDGSIDGFVKRFYLVINGVLSSVPIGKKNTPGLETTPHVTNY